MNLKKIIASVAACALAVSAMAVNTFALTTSTHMSDKLDMGRNEQVTIWVVSEKPEEEKPSWITYSGYELTDVYGVTFHVTLGDGSAEWYGGGIGANSNSTGWKSIEWGTNGKEVTYDAEKGTLTWLSDAPIFKADDKYAQLWMQNWTDGQTLTVTAIDILGKDGVVLSDDVSDADAEAAFNAANSEENADEAADDAAADDTAADTDDAAEAVDEDTDAADDTEVVDDAADDTDAVDDTDADVADDSADNDVADAPAADTSTPVAATGNTAAASIAVVMAVAGAAAVAAKKRK